MFLVIFLHIGVSTYSNFLMRMFWVVKGSSPVNTHFPFPRKWSWSSCPDSSGTSVPSRLTTSSSTCSRWWWRIMGPCWRRTRWRASGTMQRSWSFSVPRNSGNLSDSGQERREQRPQFVVSLGLLLSNFSPAENQNILWREIFSGSRCTRPACSPRPPWPTPPRSWRRGVSAGSWTLTSLSAGSRY